jgi:hypothetical protein
MSQDRDDAHVRPRGTPMSPRKRGKLGRVTISLRLVTVLLLGGCGSTQAQEKSA